MSKAVPGFGMNEAPQLLTRELAEEVREELRRARLQCAVLGCDLKLAGEEETEALRVREIYRAHLRFAAWIGALCVGTETPPAEGPEGEACRTEDGYQLFLKRVKPLVAEAEELGVTLAIEPVCTHIIHDAATAERMLADLGSDHVRIILDAVNLIDSAHISSADALIRDAVRRLGDRVCVLHMKDFLPQQGAERPKPVPCGQGGMDYSARLELSQKKDLPMTLENTTPVNAEQTRLRLERLAAG